jgi:hypothetical protein
VLHIVGCGSVATTVTTFLGYGVLVRGPRSSATSWATTSNRPAVAASWSARTNAPWREVSESSNESSGRRASGYLAVPVWIPDDWTDPAGYGFLDVCATCDAYRAFEFSPPRNIYS